MQLYLPIADIPVNIFLILAMGAAVGFVSGMFGIGGGFLMTPLLIFIGIAPAVAVASVASHIAASSFSGAISYWRRRAIDPALALVLLSGGIVGTALFSIFWFVAKVFGFLLLYIWVRGTLPRFRYDQLMSFGWKFLLPVAMANIIITSLIIALRS